MTDLRQTPDDPRNDRDLWGAIGGAVPVPPPAPDFRQRLETRLAAAALGGGAPSEDAAAASSARSASPRRHPVRWLVAAAAVAAAAAVIAFVALPALRGTDTATAADMLASMSSPAVNAKTVKLTIREGAISEDSPASPVPDSELAAETLILSTAGDYSRVTVGHHKADAEAGLTAGTTTDTWTYDEAQHKMMSLNAVEPDDGHSVLAIERPSWGSYIWESAPSIDFQGLAATLRARLAEQDPDAPVTETMYLGRPAWHADFVESLPGNDGKEYATHWSVTVDKATGLLMRSDFGSGPEMAKNLMSFWVAAIELNPELPDDWQRIPESGQPRIAIDDVGTRFGSPASVAKRTWPTLVLVPQRVPSGYRLTDVASTDFDGMQRSLKMKSRLDYLSYRDPHKIRWVRTSIDGSVQRVLLRYRRGFTMFTIDIRPNGSRAQTPGPSRTQDATDVKLSAGYLTGRTASTSIAPNFGRGPTLIVKSDRSTITISGNLTRREMIAVANSMKAYGDADKPLPKGYGVKKPKHRSSVGATPQSSASSGPKAAPLKPVWSGVYATAENDGFTAVATGSDGAVYAAGYALAKIPGAGSSMLLVKYVDGGATMSEAWHVLSGSEPIAAQRVAVDSSGNVIVAGTQGAMDLSGKGSDIVVIKVSPAGKVLWRRAYDGPSHLTDYVTDLALDAHDNALVAGSSTGKGTGRDYLTLKLRADGRRAWARTYAGPARFDEARGVAVDAGDNVYVTGWSDDRDDRARRAMMISYSPAGAQRWTARDRTRGSWSGAMDVMLSTSSGAPHVVITGYQGSPAGHEVLMFARYSAATGEQIWKRLLHNGAQASEPEAGAIDGSGAPVAVGNTNVSSRGGAFITGVAPGGSKEWSSLLSSEFDTPGDAEFDAVAMSAGGSVLAGGWTQGAKAPDRWEYLPTAFAVRYSPKWPISAPLDYIGPGRPTSRNKCTAVAIGADGMYAVGERTTAKGDQDAVLVKF
jgi:hypothetical protein